MGSAGHFWLKKSSRDQHLPFGAPPGSKSGEGPSKPHHLCEKPAGVETHPPGIPQGSGSHLEEPCQVPGCPRCAPVPRGGLCPSDGAFSRGLQPSPSRPPASAGVPAPLHTSETVSSHHSHSLSHQRMEITFHDSSSDVAIFCVDQNNKTNQTLGI